MKAEIDEVESLLIQMSLMQYLISESIFKKFNHNSSINNFSKTFCIQIIFDGVFTCDGFLLKN
ncbi:hypothetical protein BpHYR1_003585 [Brachionus plicatilis]|uniref:Uncharacterized protein n=1 Tax=Brachionus plicatilis TaxID=10195 RepID=A0A3M7SYX1_BRAPC|nr:hypothetical protein BpHYR1_003585 [Brachionus plicatilis]